MGRSTATRKPLVKPDTPNLDKMIEVADESQSIGQFLDWLMNEQNVTLMRWTSIPHERVCHDYHKPRYAEEARLTLEEIVALEAEFRGGDPHELPPDPSDQHPETCTCEGTGYIRWSEEGWEKFGSGGDTGIAKILAPYYDIDYDEMQRERDAVLAWVRAQNGVT